MSNKITKNLKTLKNGPQTAKDVKTAANSVITNYRFLGGTADTAKNNSNAIIFTVLETKEITNLDEAKDTFTKIQKNLEDGSEVSDAGMANLSKIVASIVLPLPNSLQESISHAWTTQPGLQGALNSKLSALGTSFTGVDINKALGQGATMTGARAPIVDPGFFQQYGGTEPRRYTFSWELLIQTKSEALAIFEIVRMFKMYSAPTTAIRNAILVAPNFWKVKIQNALLRDALNLTNSVVTQVDVDYAGSGIMDMYYDGTPKYIKLTVGFSEIRAITAADFQNKTKMGS